MARNLIKNTVVGFACLFLTGGLSSLGSTAAAAEETIKIGMLGAYSGPIAALSKRYLEAVQFAVDEKNAKGGLLGKKIEIITEDHGYRLNAATRKAKKLIIEDKINFLGTDFGSHISIAMNKMSKAYKTIYINPGGLSDHIQGKEFSRYAFRLCYNTHALASALAKYLATKPYRRFYSINPDIIFGHDFARAIKEQLKIHLPDAKIVGEVYHPMRTKEFAPYITKVIDSKPDAIITASFSGDGYHLIKAAREQGLKAPFPIVTYSAFIDLGTVPRLKDDALGLHGAADYLLGVDTPENRKMIARWHEKHKGDDYRGWWPAIGRFIICWNMTFAAVEKAGSLDPEKIIEAFEGFWYKSVAGWWVMRKCDHQAIMPMFAGEVKWANPYFDGSIDPKVKFPYVGRDIMKIPAIEVSIPPTSDYNPRCP